MSEAFPDVPDMSVSEISEMVQLWTLDKPATLQDPAALHAAAFSIYQAAACKGNPEEIFEAEERLRSIRETYGEELRKL